MWEWGEVLGFFGQNTEYMASRLGSQYMSMSTKLWIQLIPPSGLYMNGAYFFNLPWNSCSKVCSDKVEVVASGPREYPRAHVYHFYHRSAARQVCLF
jgi:hypothetical protein